MNVHEMSLAVEGLCSLDHRVLGLVVCDGEWQIDLEGAAPVRQWQSKYDELLRTMRKMYPNSPEQSQMTITEACELTGLPLI